MGYVFLVCGEDRQYNIGGKNVELFLHYDDDDDDDDEHIFFITA